MKKPQVNDQKKIYDFNWLYQLFASIFCPDIDPKYVLEVLDLHVCSYVQLDWVFFNFTRIIADLQLT